MNNEICIGRNEILKFIDYNFYVNISYYQDIPYLAMLNTKMVQHASNLMQQFHL